MRTFMMSGLDVGVLLLVFAGAFVGMKIGVVSAFFNLLAGFSGSWAASRFYVTVTEFLSCSPSLSYFLIFFAVAGIFISAGILLSHLLQNFFLGLIDKFMGAFLGMGFGLLFSAVVLLPVLLNQSSAVKDMVRRSAFAPYLMRTTQKYLRITPRTFWDRVDPLLESDEVRRVRRLLETSP